MPLPFTHSGARTAFYLVFGVFLALELLTRARSRLNGEGAREDRNSLLVVWFAVAGGLGAAFALAAQAQGAAIGVARWPLFVLGLVLMASGVAFRQWAILSLGRYFTVDVRVHSGQPVVQSGPYRWVRHPSYTGLLLTLAGVGLALGNWAALLVLFVLPPAGLVHRIRLEERALTEALGEPYRRFAATRARLVPGLW